jgi:hypothetical protein
MRRSSRADGHHLKMPDFDTRPTMRMVLRNFAGATAPHPPRQGRIVVVDGDVLPSMAAVPDTT